VKWLCVLLLVSGCDGADLCAYPELKMDTCATIHLNGTLNAGVKDFDQIVADVTYSLAGSSQARRISPTRLGMATMPATLPAAFGIVYPTAAKVESSSSTVKVQLLKNGTVVGYNRAVWRESLAPTLHGHLSVEIRPAVLSDPDNGDCFNGLKDSSESDIDCGDTQCPLCAAGAKCFDGRPCASGSCNRPSGSSTGTCL
jgi:hypothetical protein